MKISFVIPSRNNLKYFKWAYAAIRKNQGNHEVYICAADDASTDGTFDYFNALRKEDDHFSFISNGGTERVGHTVLYDRIINELVQTDVAIIFHADMYLCPNALDEIERLMYSFEDSKSVVKHSKTGEEITIATLKPVPKYKTIVSLTRIEPPLHPDGPEKVLANFGTEPDQFDESKFLSWFQSDYRPKHNKDTDGVFAPWAFFVKDFKEIGGHDKLYIPQSKEDSDIFNRFKLNGVTFIQTWRGCVYHLTCRGSRFNPLITSIGSNSEEWEKQNLRSAKNFIRKWGTYVEHTPLMNPIVQPKYNIDYVITNATIDMLEVLEIWAHRVYTDLPSDIVTGYIQKTQPQTDYDLSNKIRSISEADKNNDIIVYVDGTKFNETSFQIVQKLQSIIQDSGSVGRFQLENLDITINKMVDYNQELIKNDSKYTENQRVKKS